MSSRRSGCPLLCVLALSACAEQPFQRPANVADATCIREAYVGEVYLEQAVRDCGIRVPDLSGDPGLQRQASLSAIPFIMTEHAAGGKSQTYLCRGTPPVSERLDTPYASVGRCTALRSS